MKYIAIIDADEKPVSCEFIGCKGNIAPYLIGATTNIKALEQEPVLDKIRAEIKVMSGDIETIADVLAIIDKYKTESEDTDS